MVNRKETTSFLSNLLERDRLSGSIGKYWAKEVTIGYGISNVKRIDYMQFEPAGVTSVSSIEKGMFICYEVKSCPADVYSGNGLNFIGEKNYIVTTMECYKSIMDDIRSGKLDAHIKECSHDYYNYYGIMVAIPILSDVYAEFENPTPLDEADNWKLHTIIPCRQGLRKRSMTEMLFYMLRSGH